MHVQTPDHLSRLTHSYGRYDAIMLPAGAVGQEEKAKAERRLMERYADCGCDAGAIAMLVAIAALLILPIGIPGDAGLTKALVAIGMVSAAAFVGKAIGIGIARVRLAIEVKKVRQHLVIAPEADLSSDTGSLISH